MQALPDAELNNEERLDICTVRSYQDLVAFLTVHKIDLFALI
jgi:hypothetical protein